MSRRTLAVALLGAAALAVGTAGVATAQEDPPAVAQLCLATDVEQIDALLDGVAQTELVGSLAPLLSLTVPQDTGTTVKADVTLNQVRTALDCAPATTTPTPTVDPDPTPTEEPTPTTEPSTPVTPVPVFYDDCAAARAAGVTPIARGSEGYRPGLDADGDGVACEDNEEPVSGGTTTDDGVGSSTTPVGGVDTGRW